MFPLRRYFFLWLVVFLEDALAFQNLADLHRTSPWTITSTDKRHNTDMEWTRFRSLSTALDCQLLGFNCAEPTEFALTWPQFCERGGLTDIHSDGWGLGYVRMLVCFVCGTPWIF